MAKTSPGQFVQEIRQEASKVTWPSRKETTISTVMVFVMVIAASIFFLLVDWILQFGVKQTLGIGG